MTPIKLTAVLTHPIQYYAPWFRHVQANAPDIALTVIHGTQPTPEQQGVGFGRAFQWDVPLTDGYRSIIVRPAKPGDRIDSEHFTGLDVPEIVGALADTAPDVVMITGWYSVTLVRALLACRWRGVPTLCRGDSHMQSGPSGWKRPFWTLKTRILLRQFAGFLSPGVRVTEYLRWHHVPEYKIFHVPHAVDNDMFAAAAAPYRQPDRRAAVRRRLGIAPDAFVPLFVGKLVESKRPLDLLHAVMKLAPGATPVVVGSGPLESVMTAEAARLGLDLKMMGFMNQRELGEAYGIADCLVVPSDFPETWGLVVNEALATGLPCVVSDAVGGAPDLIHDGETGYLHPIGDVAALAAALSRVRDRKAGGYDWAPACRAQLEQYSYDEMTTGLVRACRSVLRHSCGPEPVWQDAPGRIIACCGLMVIAGGLERMTFEVLNAVRKQGFASHAIVNSWENFRITPLADEAGASWSTGPYWYTLTRRNLSAAIVFKMVMEVLLVSVDLLRVSRRVRPTHILLPDMDATLRNLPALLWLRLRGVRVIARQGTAPPGGRFYRNLWRRVINPVVDRFVANSDFTRRELMAHGIPGDKIETIENMPPRRRSSPLGPVAKIPGRVVFVGQLIPGKGLTVLLDAMALLRARGIDATLDVVGAIDVWESPDSRGYQASLRERASRPDLQGAVSFLGFSEDVPALLGRASVHCCPSLPELREAFGLVVLEAKLAGVASVVTPSGNLPDMIAHTRDGWLCARADAEGVAEGLAFFLTDPERAAAAGRAALASAERYNEGRFAAAWTRVFTTDSQHEYSHAL